MGEGYSRCKVQMSTARADSLNIMASGLAFAAVTVLAQPNSLPGQPYSTARWCVQGPAFKPLHREGGGGSLCPVTHCTWLSSTLPRAQKLKRSLPKRFKEVGSAVVFTSTCSAAD